MSLSVAVAHTFGSFALDASFEAPAGVTALFGRSGSGKTTLVNAIAGLFRPTLGRIILDGETLLDTARRIDVPLHRRRMGYVFQEGRLFPHLSVRQNLSYGMHPARDTDAARLSHVIELLDIAPLIARRPRDLSGGEKQRVAIGRALLCDPQLLLMDEPLAALDEARKSGILPYLERLRDETQVPIVYVSHAMAEVARLATTLVVLDGGRVLRAGPVAEVLADPALAPSLGLRDAGAVLPARLAAHDADGLSRLQTSAGPLWLPHVAAEPGARLRVRIAAQDVILARTRPEGLSALNILPGSVSALRIGDGPGALVQVAVGTDRILARITRRSAEALGLECGTQVFVILKSVSVAPADVGTPERPDP